MVNEKQQDITLDCGVVLFSRQDVNTAFCPGSKAIFPYFYKELKSIVLLYVCLYVYLPIVDS